MVHVGDEGVAHLDTHLVRVVAPRLTQAQPGDQVQGDLPLGPGELDRLDRLVEAAGAAGAAGAKLTGGGGGGCVLVACRADELDGLVARLAEQGLSPLVGFPLEPSAGGVM